MFTHSYTNAYNYHNINLYNGRNRYCLLTYTQFITAGSTFNRVQRYKQSLENAVIYLLAWHLLSVSDKESDVFAAGGGVVVAVVKFAVTYWSIGSTQVTTCLL